MIITIFGSSQPQPGSPAYQDALELGALLAREGLTVQTGGYIGTMEAVSKGANEAGGRVIGVTCSEIEVWRPVKANSWVTEEKHFDTLLERLNELVMNCVAALALPGGPGTLTEIALTWNLLIIQAIPAKPLILIGQEWKQVIGTFATTMSSLTSPAQRDLLSFSPDNRSAINQIRSLLSYNKVI